MKFGKRIIAVVLASCLALFVLGGCANSSKKVDVNANTPAGAAPVLDYDHEGRYDSTGAKGCYGCHGAGENADPMLKGAEKMPDHHYLNNDRTTKQINDTHLVCISCHVQARPE